MKLIRRPGSTSHILQIFIRDSSSTTGAGLTGLVFNTASLTAYFHRNTDTTATVINLVTMTVGSFTSSGFKEIDATNMPGWYQFCPPDASYAVGATNVSFHLKGAANMAPLPIEVDLDAQVDVYFWNGTAVASPATAGIPDVNVKNMNNVSTSSVTTINANQGQTQPVNFTGTGASALVKSDAIDIGSTAQTGRDIGASVLLSAGTGTGQLDFTSGVVKASLAQILGTAFTEGAAGRMAAAFKQFFNIASPTSTMNLVTAVTTVTTSTNLTNAPTSGDFTAAMKTSLNAATPASVVGSVGSVTGAVGSVTARVTANTDQLAGQTVTAAAGVTFPTSVASPTNITAGTITTTTNLTNAPTAGDFTATMKTSLNAATPASVVGSVGSVTGNVGGNVNGNVVGSVASVVGAVGSVTAGVTVTTNNDKTGYSLSTAAAQAIWAVLTSALTTVGSIGALLAALPGSIWDVVLSGHTTAGTTGAALNSAGSAGDPWATAIPGAYGAGTAGNIVGNRLDAAVSTRLATSGYTAPDNSDIAAIKAKTDNLPASPAAVSDIPTALTNATTLLKLDLSTVTGEAARSVLNALRFLRNKWTLVSTTLTVTKEDDTTTAWTATVGTTAGANPVTSTDPT